MVATYEAKTVQAGKIMVRLFYTLGAHLISSTPSKWPA